ECDGDLAAAQLPAWGTNFEGGQNWFTFLGQPGSCAQALKSEQTLLCAADKLAEVGDAVGPILWKGQVLASSSNPAGTYDSGKLPPNFLSEWRIPPQAEKDRFIVRDLAIHALGMLATV